MDNFKRKTLIKWMVLLVIFVPLQGKSKVTEEDEKPVKQFRRPYQKAHKQPLIELENVLDLHGAKSAAQAKDQFFKFMKTSIKHNLSELKIITGRGSHSNLPEGEYGVLSKSLPSWIKQAGWIQRKVKKCNLSHYGGCYTIFLQTAEKLTEYQIRTLPLEKKWRLRESAKATSKSFKRCFRNQKYGSKFSIAVQDQY